MHAYQPLQVCKRYDLDPTKIYTNDDAWAGRVTRDTMGQSVGGHWFKHAAASASVALRPTCDDESHD